MPMVLTVQMVVVAEVVVAVPVGGRAAMYHGRPVARRGA
jgi:hypothetical protein